MQLRRVRSRKWMEETFVENGRGRRRGVDGGGMNGNKEKG